MSSNNPVVSDLRVGRARSVFFASLLVMSATMLVRLAMFDDDHAVDGYVLALGYNVAGLIGGVAALFFSFRRKWLQFPVVVFGISMITLSVYGAFLDLHLVSLLI